MESGKGSRKREKSSIDSNVGRDRKTAAASTTNGLNGSPSLRKKRFKTETQPSVDAVRRRFSIWVCQNRQLDRRIRMELDNETCFTVSLKELCEIYAQPIDEAVLFIQNTDDIWLEINPKDDHATLREIGIEQYNTISLEQRKPVITFVDDDVQYTSYNVNPIRKIHLIVKYIGMNQEMQIECNENDTINMLKGKICVQLPSDLNYEFFQLFIDSKLIDTTYDDRTLASLDVISTSSITIDISRKLKTKRSNQRVKSNGHCGLRNLGHTCYMNSALQCLSHVIPLTDYFLQCQDVEGDVAQSYSDFIRNVWGNKTIFEPRRIKMSVSNYAPQFADFTQEDAHEFMTFLLSQLHIDLKQQQSTSIISQLFHGRVDGTTTCLTCGYVRSTPNLITFIPVSLDKNKKKRRFIIDFEPIYPETLTVETDASGHVKHLLLAFINELQLRQDISTKGLFERVQILSIRTGQELTIETPLSDILDTNLKFLECKQVLRKSHSSNCMDQSSFELADCIRDFVALEIPETLWFCKSQCQQAVHAAKQMKLAVLPPVLIVQLRRFINENGRRRKLQTFIKFPMNGLDLSEFVLDQQATPLYNLIAVVNHIGTTIDRGHYTTYARQLDDSTAWYSFNDEHVSPIEESDVVSQDAYLLVYVKHE